MSRGADKVVRQFGADEHSDEGIRGEHHAAPTAEALC